MDRDLVVQKMTRFSDEILARCIFRADNTSGTEVCSQHDTDRMPTGDASR